MKIFADRPAEFWSLMGPIFADQKIRRALPYLHDEGDFVWIVAGKAVCEGFCCFTVAGREAVVREIWRRLAPGAAKPKSSPIIDLLLQYLGSVGAEHVVATLDGDAADLLRAAGFRAIEKKGKYSKLARRLPGAEK